MDKQITERDIEIDVKGLKVRGTLCSPQSDTKTPIVLMLHGFTGNKNESVSNVAPEGKYKLLADKLAKRGISSLRINMLGSGNSDGKFEDTSAYTWYDSASAAFDYIYNSNQFDNSKISVLGLSFGGFVACMLAGNRTSKIHSLCLWNPAVNMLNVMSTITLVDQIPNFKETDTVYTVKMPKWDNQVLLKGKFFQSISEVSPHAEISKYHGDVLVQIGLQDSVVWPEPFIAQGLLNYHQGKHELWTVNGGHGFENHKDNLSLLDTIDKTVEFFSKIL